MLTHTNTLPPHHPRAMVSIGGTKQKKTIQPSRKTVNRQNMKAKYVSASNKLIASKTERNAMLLLEFLEEKQESLPQLRMKITTFSKDVVHSNFTQVYHIRFYLNGAYASDITYKQFMDYLNNNQ